MFTSARWRLTAWFVPVLALILGVIGVAVFFTARAFLFDSIDDDLRSRADTEMRLLIPRLAEHPLQDIVVGPEFTAGGYFYALVNRDGELLAGTPNMDPRGLAGQEAIDKALDGKPTFRDTESSDREHLRVYVLPVDDPQAPGVVLEVGRSVEPEWHALGHLIAYFGIGGVVGLALALVGGYFLAGRALRPIGEAMDRQKEFVADASHELRTPLSLIRANAELLQRHPGQPVEANMPALDDIIRETDGLSTLVSQLLTLAKADAGAAPFASTEVALHELVEDVGKQVRVLADEKGLELEVRVEGPLVVKGDQVRLRDLLLILLDNAIKFTDAGASVRLTLRTDGGKGVVQVRDSGKGIPPDTLPHVFDRFYRADKARSRAEGGAGLGLAIAKWIVEGHRGSIRVDTQAEKGTTFTVELPIK